MNDLFRDRDREQLEKDYEIVGRAQGKWHSLQNINLRLILACTIGIIAWITLFLGLDFLLSEAGIATYIDFDEPMLVPDGAGDYTLADGDFTGVGTIVNILSVMFAIRIGMAVSEGHWRGGVSKTGEIDFLVWACGLSFYGIGNTILLRIFEDSDFHWLFIPLDLVLIVGLFFIFFKIRQAKKAILDRQSLTPGRKLYKVKEPEYSEDFKKAFLEAGNHLSRMGGKDIRWLATRPIGNIAHLVFGLGNQLFCVLVRTVNFKLENQTHYAASIEGPSEQFLDFCKQANAVPCMMIMQPHLEFYQPLHTGWGLIDAESFNSSEFLLINPPELVTNDLIEMSEWELHDFAIDVVKQHLAREKKDVTTSQSHLKIDPSIWFLDNKSLCWVIVRSACYPTQEAKVPENIESIKAHCRGEAEAGFFASVTIANANQPDDKTFVMPLYRGHAMHITFEGLKKIS